MKKTLTAAALGLLIAAPAMAVAPANLIVNGSFEATAQADGSWAVYNAVAGWSTASGSGIELRNNSVGTAFDGSNFVELDGYGNTANTVMEQTLLTTTAGQLYNLNFVYAGRTGVADAATNGLAVAWNGITLTTLAEPGGIQHNWLAVGLQVTGTGNDVLSFRATGMNDGFGRSLDNVSLTAAVPEPGTYAMMVVGLLAVGFLARRRKAD